MENEKILEKIKKCFALAKSTNPHEAEIALRQARKLMEAHQLERSDVLASSVNEILMSAGKRPATWALCLGQSCATAFGCTVLVLSTHSGKQFIFIGQDGAPTFSQYAYEVLLRQLQSARKEYVNTLYRCKLSTKRRRGDIFANTWVNAVRQLISQFAQKNSSAEESISAYITKHYPVVLTKELTHKKIAKNDRNAAYSGFKAGRSAQIHQPMGRESQQSLSLF